MVGLAGGSGGGGYSGGGGGGEGPANGEAGGNPGGAGGEVSGEVGSGGGAWARFDSPRLVVMHSMVNVVGGNGGHGGLAGESNLLLPGEYLSGGGGGGYSAGGGGGASTETIHPCGAGGAAGLVYGAVGYGGDVEYIFSSDRPSIHQDTVMSDRIGWAGISSDASAVGDVGGRGAGRASMPGELHKYIPMSLPILWGPSDGADIPYVPVFDWMPVHDSTTNGAVVAYGLVLDDDLDFSSPVMVNTTNESKLDPGWIEMGPYHWRVYAVYGGPPGVPGPFSDSFSFRFLNAPPRITSEPTHRISERVPQSIYVGDFVDDPDNGISELSVNCTHYAVTSTLGLFIMFYYPKWVPTHTVEYLVNDGVNWVRGKMTIIVLDINDDPKIETIGGLVVPVTIELEEGKEKRLVINTTDLDGDELSYDLEDSWPGASLEGNVLCLNAEADELGWFRTTLVVSDGKGGSDETRVRIHVVNAKQPPGPPEVFAPENHSRYKAGQPVSFTVKVTDPDIVWGETLTVTWASDVSGVLMSQVTTDTAGFSTSALPVGEHRITITVSDGTFSRSTWLDITIVEGDVGSGPPPETSNWGMYLLGVLLLGLMLLVGYAAGTRGVNDEV
jgi:hypothetical protein